MDSIAIGWKKQAPGRVEIGTKNREVQNQPLRKILAPRRQQRIQQDVNTIPMRPIGPTKVHFEDHPYKIFAKPDLISKSSNDTSSEIQIFNDNQLCSTRAVIATFIIVALIVLVAGTSVGVVFATIKSSGSSGSNSNSGGSSNNQNSYTTITSGSVTSNVIIGSQSGPGCSSYTQIDDPTRSITSIGVTTSCDNSATFNATTSGSWIRFTGAGRTTMPMSSPGMNRCGGFLSGYFNDTLPVSFGVTQNANVCFDTDSLECVFSVNVSVIYCSPGFYVYLLPALPVCNARYCTT